MRRNALSKFLKACSGQITTGSSAAITHNRTLVAIAALKDVAGMQHIASQASHSRNNLAPSFAAASITPAQRRSLFIQTQPTPNPSSMMFIPGQTVMESGSKSFGTAREAMASALAKRLFTIDGISQVFFGSDFVTVTKSDDYTWAVLKPDIFAAITEFYAANEPLFYDAQDPSAAEHMIQEDDDEVVAMIKELLETRIRPAVQEDGGDIVFQEFDPDTGVVMLKMMGACDGCPSSAITLKSGIENMLMHYIPEVKGVIEAGPDEHEDEGMKAFNKLEQHLSN